MNDETKKIGKEVDDLILGDFNQNLQNFNHKISFLKGKIESIASNEDKSYLYYFLGNIYLEYYYKKNKNKASNKIEAIKCFFKAINSNLDRNHLIPIYTNLGNILFSENRYYEAVLFYEKALMINNNFLLSFGQQINAFEEIWENINHKVSGECNEFFRVVLLKINDLQSYLDKTFADDEIEYKKGKDILLSFQIKYQKFFDEYYYNYNNRTGNNESIKDSILIEGDKKLKENKYIIWCRDNSLLLDFMNLIKHKESLKDNLVPLGISLENGHYIFSAWKTLVQEFCYSRYILYKYKDLEFIDSNDVHISDISNFVRTSKFGYIPILNIGGKKEELAWTEYYENSLLNFEIEEMKSSYIKLYNLLDKISVLLIYYIKEFKIEKINEDSFVVDIKNLLAEIKDNDLSFC